MPEAAQPLKVSDNAKRRTVEKIAAADAYLVQYRDGANKEATALVFHVPGSTTAFMVQEKIQGQFVVTAANPWFNKSFLELINENRNEPESV